MTSKVIYFTVNSKDEQAEFRSDDSLDDVKDVFRAAAEAGPYDILKLYNTQGSLVRISPQLPDNTPATRYRLEVVATYNAGSALANMGINLGEIESRISSLEHKMLVECGEVPVAVDDLRKKLDYFTHKLEHVDHLSWLGLYKEISIGTQPFWNKQNHSGKKSTEHCRRVFEKFITMSHVEVTAEVREYLKKATFDNWQWEEPEMLLLLRQMYIDLGLVTKFNIQLSTLHHWLYEIYSSYNLVPFHNFKHCFMVTQMMYGLVWLVGGPGGGGLLTDLDILILITAAICHDLDHPGYNNAYQVNARTKLALRYNDISPLENHHCSVAFQILMKPECNILGSLTSEQFKRVREGMIKCILATDMSKHNHILHQFKTIIPEFDIDKCEHKDLLMNILIKVSDISNEARPTEVSEPWVNCLLEEFFNQLLTILIKAADISNEVRPVEVAEPWADCLLQEFFQQSDVEKLEGLPVAPFMDRDKVTKASSQVGFIKFCLLPLFEALADLLPATTEEIVTPVRKALEYYQNMQKTVEERNADKDAENDKLQKNGIKQNSIERTAKVQ